MWATAQISKGYKFIDPKTSKVIVSRDAVFIENPQIDKKSKIQNSSESLETSCDDIDNETKTQKIAQMKNSEMQKIQIM